MLAAFERETDVGGPELDRVSDFEIAPETFSFCHFLPSIHSRKTPLSSSVRNLTGPTVGELLLMCLLPPRSVLLDCPLEVDATIGLCPHDLALPNCAGFLGNSQCEY